VYMASFALIKRWTPPRPLVLAGILLGAVAVVVAPEYRSRSLLGADKGKISDIDVAGITRETLEEGGQEFVSSVILISAFNQEARFNYGRGFYNALVKNFLPRVIVGTSFKRSLFAKTVRQDDLTMKYYGWIRGAPTTPVGPVSAFREFWFLGCFLYFAFGAGFGFLWRKATEGSQGAQVIYVALSPLALLLVTFGPILVLTTTLNTLLFLVPILLFATRKGQVVPEYTNVAVGPE